jgi:hypothetical protein
VVDVGAVVDDVGAVVDDFGAVVDDFGAVVDDFGAVVDDFGAVVDDDRPSAASSANREGGSGIVAPSGTKATVIISPLLKCSAVMSDVTS